MASSNLNYCLKMAFFLQYGKPQEDIAISMDSINAVHTFDKFQLFILNHFHMTHYSYMLTAILCLIITLPLEIHKHYFF